MANTIIKTAHEETYSDGRCLGILTNYENDSLKRIDSFAYIFRDDMYIFFETIVDMIDYLLYGEGKVKRSYMKEIDFDNYYDNGMEGTFEEVLKWSK